MTKRILYIFIAVFAFAACAHNSNNQNSNNPIIPDHFDLPLLSYTVKTNGNTEVNIEYTDNKNELQKIVIPLQADGIPRVVFEITFDTPGDVHFISVSVPTSDSTHTLLFVSTEHFTTFGKYNVEISY